MRREQFWEKTAFVFLFPCVHGKVRGVQQKKKKKKEEMGKKKKHEKYFFKLWKRPQAAIDIILSICTYSKGQNKKKAENKTSKKDVVLRQDNSEITEN